jgi:hypothetical protein
MAEGLTDYGSIFAPVTKMDPTHQAAQVMGIRSRANEVAMQEQVLRARPVLGQIMQSAIDPQTGQVNYAKAAAGVASHPETAWMAADFMKQMADLKLTNAAAVKGEMENQITQLGVVAKVTGALRNNPDFYNPAKSDGLITKALDDMATAYPGVIPKEMAQQVATQLLGEKNLAHRAEVIKNYGMAALSSSEFVNRQYGQLFPTQNGAGTSFNVVGTEPNSPARTQGFQPMGLPPNRSERQTEEGATESVVEPGVSGGAMQPGPGVGPAGGMPGGQAAPGSSGAGGGEAAAPPSAQQGAQMGGVAPVGGGPKALGAIHAGAAKQVAQMQMNFQDRTQAITKSLQNLNEFEQAAEAAKAKPGSESWKKIGDVLQAMGVPQENVDKIVGGDQAARQVAMNASMQFVLTQLNDNLKGSPTGQEFVSISGTKHNINWTPTAIKAVVNFYKEQFAVETMQKNLLQKYAKQGMSPLEIQSKMNAMMERYWKIMPQRQREVLKEAGIKFEEEK